MSAEQGKELPDARSRVDGWAEGWRDHGAIVVLLDFDGTLAPIVERPESVGIPPATRSAVERLIACEGAHVSIVSGRGLADVRARARLEGIAYAGNHGMEIEGHGLEQVHPEAAAARPQLERVIEIIEKPLSRIPGAIVEDKHLTLSIHYRLVVRALVERVREVVLDAAGSVDGLRVTEGKEVLEVRPDVDWHKGRAVDFLVKNLSPPSGTPILYIGDDRTDEDAFEALREREGGEGIIVTDEAKPSTAALSRLKAPEEVAELVDLLVERGPC